MRQKEVFNKIGVILKELNDQYKYLEANPDDMNALELELFAANAHFLADHAQILNKINLQLSTARPALPAATDNKKEEPGKEEPKQIEAITAEPKSEEKYFEPVVRQPVKKQVPVNIQPEQPPVINFEVTPTAAEAAVTAEPEIIRHELDIEEIEDWEDEDLEPDDESIEEVAVEEQEDVAPQEVPQAVEPATTTTLPEVVKAGPNAPVKAAEEAKGEVLTINQRISAQLNKGGVTDQPANTRITDLKQAISLNDKLLYIKDLFNGYNLAYSEAIEILNRLGSFEDAERFLTKNYVVKNNWESKADTAAKFYAVLKRRYM